MNFTIEISNVCIARCFFCLRIPSKNPPSWTVLNRLSTMKRLGMKKVRLTGGEPILANQFPQIVDWLKENDIAIEMTTTLLSRKKDVLDAILRIDNLRISLSAVGDFYDTYFQVMNEYFYEVVDPNIRFLLDNGKSIRFDYLLCERTCQHDRLKAFIDYMNSLVSVYGADRVGRVVYIKEIDSNYDGDVTESLAKLREEERFHSNSDFTMTRYEEEALMPLPSKCMMANYHMYVKHDGSIYPCCVSGGEIGNALDGRLCLGDILDYTPKWPNIDVDGSFAPCKNCFNKYKVINEKIMAFDDEMCKINY